jgi:hypothetical protein
MAHPETLERLVRRVAAQVRRRRVEHYALRGAFWSSLVAVLALLFKHPLGAWALPLAGAALVAGTLAGGVWGALRRTPIADAARLADRTWELQDRVATALEWAARPDRTQIVDALIADTVERVEQLQARMAARRIIPRDGRLLPIPLALAVVLALAPGLPLPSGRLPDFSTSGSEDPIEARGDASLMEERAKALPKDRLKSSAFEERDFATHAGTGSGAMAGDLSAIFKDTNLSAQRPDFQSFLKKGDERLKLLDQADRLPDLQSDFTASQYKMVYRKSKALTSGLRPDQISPQKLKELLDEMERLGRKGGANWQGDAAEGMEAMEGGQTDRALEAMQRALDKMRAQEEAGRAGKNLKGGRESARGGVGRDRRGGGDGSGPDDQDFGEGEGMLPGKGRSGTPKGEATGRLRASPYDVGVEGESRRGRKDSYDTNLTGKGGQMGSRLQYLGVIGQYRKMMEDAIARESVPRDFHTQIKDYFQALDER